MELIKKIIFDNNPKNIKFDNFFIDDDKYLFQNNGFWKWKNKYSYVKDWLKDIQYKEEQKNKTEYPMYVILNQRNQVTDMIPVKLPAYLVDFYEQNRNNQHNYALAVEKFGHFRKDRLEYMHPDGKKLFYKHQGNFSFIIKKIKSKQEAVISGLKDAGKKVECQELKQTWRMATGLGNASAYNNGFTFHPVFGIPYLGGQQIKGIVRTYLIRKYFYKPGKTGKQIEQKAMNDPLFAYLFGREKNEEGPSLKGHLHFLDAFPVDKKLEMKADIMNPHYGEYYSEGKPPGDYLSPNPIFFLSVVNGTFNFCFWIEKEINLKKENSKTSLEIKDNETLSEYIERILPEALQELGIGAKTAVGYGRFKKQISINQENKKQ